MIAPINMATNTISAFGNCFSAKREEKFNVLQTLISGDTWPDNHGLITYTHRYFTPVSYEDYHVNLTSTKFEITATLIVKEYIPKFYFD